MNGVTGRAGALEAVARLGGKSPNRGLPRGGLVGLGGDDLDMVDPLEHPDLLLNSRIPGESRDLLVNRLSPDEWVPAFRRECENWLTPSLIPPRRRLRRLLFLEKAQNARSPARVS